jgi:diacylglycerol kinase family enzyme
MSSQVQVVVTPGSGEGRARATARRLRRALTRRGAEVQVRTFRDLEALESWAATCEPDFSHLVAIGGDATLSAAARAAMRLSVPFVPVPNGFGNIFSRAFGHEDRTRSVLSLFDRGELKRVDVGVIDGETVFLSHRSYGMLEDVQEAVEEGRAQPKSRFRRHLAYYARARRYMFATPMPSIRVEVDGALIAENAAVVTVANVETYRGYLSLTPTASPIDGLFDVFVIPRTAKPLVWARLLLLFLQTPGRWSGVLLCRGRQARVTVQGRPTEELSVRRAVLPLLVPPGSVSSLVARQAEADAALAGESGVPSARELSAEREAALVEPAWSPLPPPAVLPAPARSTPSAGPAGRG